MNNQIPALPASIPVNILIDAVRHRSNFERGQDIVMMITEEGIVIGGPSKGTMVKSIIAWDKVCVPNILKVAISAVADEMKLPMLKH